MSWLLLNKTGLYLMDGGAYKEKTDLNTGPEPGEFNLDIPLEWADADDQPGTVIVEMESNTVPPKK